MKTVLTVLMVMFSTLVYAQAANQEVERIDGNSIRLTTRIAQVIEKNELLDQKTILEADILRAQREVEAIDQLLTYYK